jgi:hypothetical protein
MREWIKQGKAMTHEITPSVRICHPHDKFFLKDHKSGTMNRVAPNPDPWHCRPPKIASSTAYLWQSRNYLRILVSFIVMIQSLEGVEGNPGSPWKSNLTQ